jgi:hypothetical protein
MILAHPLLVRDPLGWYRQNKLEPPEELAEAAGKAAHAG